jgi:hypothetical protein
MKICSLTFNNLAIYIIAGRNCNQIIGVSLWPIVEL